MSLWPQVAEQATQIFGPQHQYSFWTPTWSRVAVQTTDIWMTFKGNTDHGHGPRHSPWWQPMPQHHYGPRWLQRLLLSVCSLLPVYLQFHFPLWCRSAQLYFLISTVRSLFPISPPHVLSSQVWITTEPGVGAWVSLFQPPRSFGIQDAGSSIAM